MLGKLNIQQMEELAAESQALVDKAMAMVKANALTPNGATAFRAPVGDGDAGDARGPKYLGADVARSGDGDRPLNFDRAQTRTTPVLVAVSPSPAAVDDGAAQGPAEESTGSDVDTVIADTLLLR